MATDDPRVKAQTGNYGGQYDIVTGRLDVCWQSDDPIAVLRRRGLRN